MADQNSEDDVYHPNAEYCKKYKEKKESDSILASHTKLMNELKQKRKQQQQK